VGWHGRRRRIADLDQPIALLQQHRPRQQVARAGLRIVERDDLAAQVVERADTAILTGHEQGVVLRETLFPAAQQGLGPDLPVHLRDDEGAVDVDVDLAAGEPARHLGSVGHHRDLDVTDAGGPEPRRR
jgi:hypothetical protein